jgi:hypothetical protein
MAGGRRGKDDRKLNELAPMLPIFRLENQLEIQVQMVAVPIQLKSALICIFDHSKMSTNFFKFTSFHLKGLSHEMDLAFDDMYGQF